jgi:hypothetical protein
MASTNHCFRSAFIFYADPDPAKKNLNTDPDSDPAPDPAHRNIGR